MGFDLRKIDSAYVYIQGALLKTKTGDTKKLSRALPSAAKRGTVQRFSEKSRARMLRVLSTLQETAEARFLTLTFGKDIALADAKQAFKRFVENFRDCFPTGAFIWRRERQKSGRHHYHLIIFNTGYWHWRDIQIMWDMSVGNEVKNNIKIEAIRNRSSIIRYAAKYVAKADDLDSSTNLDFAPYSQSYSIRVNEIGQTGRMWGIHGREFMPYAEIYCVEVEEELARLIAWYASKEQRRPMDKTLFNTTHMTSSITAVREWILSHIHIVHPPPDIKNINIEFLPSGFLYDKERFKTDTLPDKAPCKHRLDGVRHLIKVVP